MLLCMYILFLAQLANTFVLSKVRAGPRLLSDFHISLERCGLFNVVAPNPRISHSVRNYSGLLMMLHRGQNQSWGYDE